MRVCGHWAGDWCSPCIGAGFDTLTFQSMIVHFFVALAQKNCPRALASTTSRSDWRRHSGPANLFYSINKFYSHPASRDQLTDQEQCEAAKRITTCAKILPIAGPKTKRQKCSGFQGRQSGPPQFKNMCGHKRSQGVENNCSRRCKTMGTQWRSGMRNFCRVPAETIETCTIFRPAAKNLPTNGPRLGVQKRTPKRGPSRPDTSKSN